MLIDQRSKEDYELGHLPNAINIEEQDLLELMQHDLLISKGINKTMPLYIYCYGGVCAKRTIKVLVDAGYNAINIGGYEELRGLNELD